MFSQEYESEANPQTGHQSQGYPNEFVAKYVQDVRDKWGAGINPGDLDDLTNIFQIALDRNTPAEMMEILIPMAVLGWYDPVAGLYCPKASNERAEIKFENFYCRNKYFEISLGVIREYYRERYRQKTGREPK